MSTMMKTRVELPLRWRWHLASSHPRWTIHFTRPTRSARTAVPSSGTLSCKSSLVSWCVTGVRSSTRTESASCVVRSNHHMHSLSVTSQPLHWQSTRRLSQSERSDFRKLRPYNTVDLCGKVGKAICSLSPDDTAMARRSARSHPMTPPWQGDLLALTR
jgi:hypothetical protein